MKDLDKIIAEEKENLDTLRKIHGNAFTIHPEKQSEYDIMKKTYASIGETDVNKFRVWMGHITNPSTDKQDKEFYINLIPEVIAEYKKQNMDVEYIEIAYKMALENIGYGK